MKINQTNRFKKAYKKLHFNQLDEVNKAIKEVIKNPNIGEQKKGSLAWLRVYKFKVIGQLTLLGYSIEKTGFSECQAPNLPCGAYKSITLYMVLCQPVCSKIGIKIPIS